MSSFRLNRARHTYKSSANTSNKIYFRKQSSLQTKKPSANRSSNMYFKNRVPYKQTNKKRRVADSDRYLKLASKCHNQSLKLCNGELEVENFVKKKKKLNEKG